MASGTLNEDRLTELLYQVIAEFNEDREDGEKLRPSLETALFGGDSALDSMDLVQVVVGFEQALAEEGFAISLADERAMSQRNSPFATGRSLVSYAKTLIDEQAGG